MDAAAAEAVATVREYGQRTGAIRVVLLVDRGDRQPLMVEADDEQNVQVTDGEEVTTIPADAPTAAPPRTLPDIRAIPASTLQLDLTSGELQAPLGAIEHLADTLRALARAFGRRSVATADFATRDPETPLTLAAREGEPTILVAGDYEYTLRQQA